MQHARHHSSTRTSVRVVVAPAATSAEVALLFAGLLGLLLILLLL